MNLFILGWNLPKEMFSTVLTELRQMTTVYPQLDPNTVWHFGEGGVAFGASMHTADRAAAPRHYVWRNNGQVTFYEGSLIDPTGGFTASNAEALSSHWDQLSDVLEGQFVAVRLNDNPPGIELLTDVLGMEQVYYLHLQDMWLVSNSVRLLVQLGKADALDPLGVSLFLSMGWVGADRTLRRDIHVIPGGQHWKWQLGDIGPSRKSYYPRSKLSCQRQKPLARPGIDRLADELMTICRRITQDYGDLQCPLTGGRDSRVLASLLINGGIKAQYYTSGHPSSADVKIGIQIAKAFSLSHKVNTQMTEDVLEEWEDASRRLTQQNDGMVNLWQIADVLQQPACIDRLSINLSGIGGEIARGFYNEPKVFLYPQGLEGIQRFLSKKLIRNHRRLIRHEAIALAQKYLQQFVEEAMAEDFAPLDVPDVFYTYERVRRWAGSNARKRKPIGDPFSPFCCRPFLEAAFATPAQHRYSESLHYELIRLLVPNLHRFPFANEPWPSQQPLLHIARSLAEGVVRKVYGGIHYRLFPNNLKTPIQPPVWDHSAWLEAMCPRLRELCLDHANSSLWDFVDRSVFQRVISNVTDVVERRRYIGGLYNVATLFYYYN